MPLSKVHIDHHRRRKAHKIRHGALRDVISDVEFEHERTQAAVRAQATQHACEVGNVLVRVDAMVQQLQGEVS